VQEQIDISEFRKVDIRIGKVVEAERVQGTDRLIRQAEEGQGTSLRVHDPGGDEGRERGRASRS